MTAILSELISAILQVIVFSLIPFLFFLFRKNKTISFTEYIGWKRPPSRAVLYVIVVALLIVAAGVGITFINEGWRQAVLSPNSVTGKIRAMGFTATSIVVLLLTAWIKTSLSEEILFRGFLAKQLIQKLGFNAGNLLQAIVFGLIHFLLFGLLTDIPMVPLVMIFGFSTLAGWIIGYIKEQRANGSIIPGWVAHGLGNTISYALIAYYL